MAQLDARQTQFRRLDADTTSTSLVNNNLKVQLYILASSWPGNESAALKRTRPILKTNEKLFKYWNELLLVGSLKTINLIKSNLVEIRFFSSPV